MGQPTRLVCFLAAALLALLAFSVCPESRGQGDNTGPWKERFLSEAPQKWEAYRSFAKGLQGTSTHKIYRDASGTPTETWLYEWRQRGQWTRSVSQGSSSQVGRDIPPAEVKVVNSRYAFVLRKKTPSSDWVLVTLDSDLRDDRPINPREQEKLVLDGSCANFGIRGRQFSEIAQESGFVLKTATGVPRDGRELVRIDFTHRHTPQTDNRRSHINRQMWLSIEEGWVLLDPEASWAISECQVKTSHLGGAQGTISFTNEYRRAESGFPVLTRRVQKARYADPTAAREETTVSTFDWYVDDTVAESEFTLTAFGLPEPLGVTWSKPTPWYLWLGLAGGLCLVGGVTFRWLKKRAIPAAHAL